MRNFQKCLCDFKKAMGNIPKCLGGQKKAMVGSKKAMRNFKKCMGSNVNKNVQLFSYKEPKIAIESQINLSIN